MPNTKTTTDVSAAGMLSYARDYHEAAEELFHSKPRLTCVLNYLYFHVVELLLKAYLRAHNRDPWGHEIRTLYIKCRGLGLRISSDDRFGLENVINLLKSGNEGMAFRYCTLKSGAQAQLGWTREVVGQLMPVVAEFVDSKMDTTASGYAVKATWIWGKPASQEKPQI